MVLADANGRLAQEPFIVHMEGFTGFLSTRFLPMNGNGDTPACLITPGIRFVASKLNWQRPVVVCMPWKSTAQEHCGWRALR